jgi:hypothetical protein
MEAEPPAESTVLDEAENQSFLGSKLGVLIHLEKSVVFQQLRKRLYIPRTDARGLAFQSVDERGLDDGELGS